MSFDRLARHYDWMECVLAGRLLQRARMRWLPDLAACRNVLSVGEGHGRFAEAFVRTFPGSRLTCVDASAAMLTRARRRLERSCGMNLPVRWINAPLADWIPPVNRFDAIITHFFLDCFPPEALGKLVERLARTAAPNAVWLIADFSVPVAGPARWRALAVHRLMYAFFASVTGIPARNVTPPDEFLQSCGFVRAGRLEFSWGLVRSDKWTRLHGRTGRVQPPTGTVNGK